MVSPPGWRAELRRVFDDAFAFDWRGHLAELNRRHGFAGRRRLATAAEGMPPVWFNGNIGALEPGRWALVVSLNPSLAREGQYDHIRGREAWWEHWLHHNRTHWYPTFFRPLVRVAAAALGESVAPEGEPDFATDRMLFVELCPYASRDFAIPRETLAELARSDPGFRTAEAVARLLVEQGEPGLILVNGRPSVESFEAVHGGAVRWQERRYPSPDRPGVVLWHREGVFHGGARPTPIAGFPFLRKPLTHNTGGELALLGAHLRALVTGEAAPTPPVPLAVAPRAARPERPAGRRDRAKLDVAVGGVWHRRLPKNRAILAAVRALCAAGVTPAEIQAHVARRPERLFHDLASGPPADPRRWFLRDDELVHVGGRTYAFSTQWGADTEAVIGRLLSAFPDRGVSCRQSA